MGRCAAGRIYNTCNVILSLTLCHVIYTPALCRETLFIFCGDDSERALRK